MNGLIESIIMGVVRTTAASAGGWLVAQGYLHSDQTQGFIGSVCFLVPIGFSIWDKFQVKNKITVAHDTLPSQPLPFR